MNCAHHHDSQQAGQRQRQKNEEKEARQLRQPPGASGFDNLSEAGECPVFA